MRMFYTEKHTLRFLSPDDTVIFQKFSRDDLEDGMVINVKSGQTTELDPVQLGNRSIQLWQLGAMDPVSLFRDLCVPNPEERAERLKAWKQFELLQQTNAEIAKSDAGAQANAAAKIETEGAKAKDRKVETNSNSRQRTERSVTGTEPVKVPGKPK